MIDSSCRRSRGETESCRSGSGAIGQPCIQSSTAMRYYSSFLWLCLLFSTLDLVLCLTGNQTTREQLRTLAAELHYPLNWNASKLDPCAWEGVTCNGSGVSKLSLTGLWLLGNIPPRICQLQGLRELDLSRNSFSGSLNMEDCSNLAKLNLSNNNYLSGGILSLSRLPNLRVLDLSRNSFGGELVQQIQNLTQLTALNLSYNYFYGRIPSSLGNLVHLKEVYLSHNQLVGELPRQIDGPTGLRFMDLSQNKLAGTIPDIFKNLTGLTYLILSGNNFSGEMPKSLVRLPNLAYLSANQNHLGGNIPAELGSISSLKHLDLSFNRFNGSIPPQLFDSRSLQSVDLTSNKLEGMIPENVYNCTDLFRLRLGTNKLSGNISSRIGSLSGLTSFEADSNSLGGEIPRELANCQKLDLLNLARNQISGQIPAELGSVQSFRELNLSSNLLSGPFPTTLSNCTKLLSLDLSGNELSGSIPETISRLWELQFLRLQNNNLSGLIPRAIGNFLFLLELQLGSNRMNGRIPEEIGLAVNLQVALNLSHNFLEGTIPPLLSKLAKLVILDFSNNKLTGEIPRSLEGMQSLIEFDVSNNELTGSLPRFNRATSINTNGTRVFRNTNSKNNTKPFHNNGVNRKSNHVASGLLIGVAVVGATVAAIAIGVAWVACKYFRHSHEMPEKEESSVIQGHLIDPDSIHRESIDFEKALQATLEPANAVLKNKFSSYYKVVMPSGTAYSVKKLNWLDKILKSGSYENLGKELEKQGNLSHPNIMLPLAYAVKTDWAILLYEYVHKGSLSGFLCSSNASVLDWPSRYSIAVGVARGLAYLHECYPPIVHLDLTSKNILLKSPKEPQIGDIELCKIICTSKKTLSTVPGSIGYIPPEYAYTMTVTMAGNVYSFGVILLELLTGKPPISNGMDLVQWVQQAPSRDETWEQILDSKVSNSSFKIRNEMMSVLRIALGCTSSSPDSRPKIRTVVRMLQIARQS